jgi:rare lipoprotein A
LSKRAADMLDYSHVGTAKVEVEYLGRAPLDGQDDKFLMASYRPGNAPADPASDGLPEGVMIAMNGDTPSGSAEKPAVAFPGTLVDSSPVPASAPSSVAFDALPLPDMGPIAPERPADALLPETQVALASMSYAQERVHSSTAAFAALGGGMTADDLIASWKRVNQEGGSPAGFVAAGSFADRGAAVQLARDLAAFGRTELERSELGGADWYSVNLYADGQRSLDDLLEAAWSNGAPEAIAVRD